MEISVSYNVMQPCNYRRFFHTLARLAVTCFLLVAIGEAETDKVTVPLTDPTRPSMVKVNLLNGSITVTAYDGKDVIVEAKTRADNEAPARAGGMKRVPMTATGLSVEEENNQVDIGAQSIQRTIKAR